MLRDDFPDIKVKVGGANIFEGNWIRGNSYGIYIRQLLKKYDIQEQFEFEGFLSADKMKKLLLESNVFVCPSSIENSPNSLGEAMILAIFYGLSEFVVEILFTLILRCRSEVFVPSIKFISKEETKSTTNLGVLFFISQISALVLFTTDNLIISHFIGPADVTSYSMVNKLYTAGTAVFAG